MKMKNVMDELLETTSYVNQCCCYCSTEFCSTYANHCETIGCESTLCNECYRNNLEVFAIDNYFNVNYEQDYTRTLCERCSMMNVSDCDDESIPEDWEDLDWEDRCGFNGY